MGRANLRVFFDNKIDVFGRSSIPLLLTRKRVAPVLSVAHRQKINAQGTHGEHRVTLRRCTRKPPNILVLVATRYRPSFGDRHRPLRRSGRRKRFISRANCIGSVLLPSILEVTNCPLFAARQNTTYNQPKLSLSVDTPARPLLNKTNVTHIGLGFSPTARAAESLSASYRQLPSHLSRPFSGLNPEVLMSASFLFCVFLFSFSSVARHGRYGERYA
jgi:hypothetical protein